MLISKDNHGRVIGCDPEAPRRPKTEEFQPSSLVRNAAM